MKEIKDEISEHDVYCPVCREPVRTYPTEGVPNQALRTGIACGHDFYVDVQTLQTEES